jgi:choloylglycine hydrolase
LPEKINLAPYELIPYLLGKCKTVAECEKKLNMINLVDVPFDKNLKNAELHWIISDKKESIVFECMKDGNKIHKNPVGVLTNNPPFEYQMMNLNNYINLSPQSPQNRFSDKLDFDVYSRGMGAIGMPGDLSSMSRFVRAVFVKLNSVIPEADLDCVGQMFHILSSVEQQEGSVVVGNKFERTQYSSCCDTDKGIYYYKTYENNQIAAISMNNEDLNDDKLVSYKMICRQQIRYVN